MITNANPDKYKVVRYGRYWYGILDNDMDVMLRVGPNPDYNGPLDDKDNKLLLFKSKDKAQEYINGLTEGFVVDEIPKDPKVEYILEALRTALGSKSDRFICDRELLVGITDLIRTLMDRIKEQPKEIFDEIFKWCNADTMCGLPNPNKGTLKTSMVEILAERYGVKL